MTLYARPKFVPEGRGGDPLEVAARLFTLYPFATLIVGAEPFHAVHTPVLVDRISTGLTLHAHVARANDWWQRAEAHPDVLAIAHGPHAAISASWYAQPSAGTWNYVASHATCRATTVHDEAHLDPDVVDRLTPAIVGVTLEVTAARSVVKMSQNKDEVTHANIVRGLEGREDAEAHAVAALMRDGSDI